MGDDGYVNVPLPFNFPFYGQVFNNSWMYDNGVVSFVQPGTQGALSPWQWSATPLAQAQGNYFIAPLWADIAPISSTTYTTEGTPLYQRYMWNNISEYYSGGTRLNTFGLDIRPDGSYNAIYSSINLSTSNVAIGSVGNVSAGEVNQIAYHPFGTYLNYLNDWSVGGVDPCITNPLFSPSCPGYQEAFLQQQCSISALYSPSCPGYAQAYFQYQCSVNPLFNTTCPGYAQAYYQYQCSLDPLYDMGCPGYQQAYYNYRCSMDPLYDSGCPGYQTAYEEKLFNDACKANAQYSTLCPGYVAPVVKNEPQEKEQTTETVTTQPLQVAQEITGNAIVDTVLSPATTSVTSTTSVSPAAVTSQVQTTPPAAVQNVVTQSVTETKPAAKTETKTESKTETKTEVKQETKAESKPLSPQQQARVEAVKKQQMEAAKNLAESVSEAKTMEAQVEAQTTSIAVMNNVQGFDAYSYIIKDSPFYKSVQIYKNQRTIDNNKSLIQLQGVGGLKYNEMINQQYKE